MRHRSNLPTSHDPGERDHTTAQKSSAYFFFALSPCLLPSREVTFPGAWRNRELFEHSLVLVLPVGYDTWFAVQTHHSCIVTCRNIVMTGYRHIQGRQWPRDSPLRILIPPKPLDTRTKLPQFIIHVLDQTLLAGRFALLCSGSLLLCRHKYMRLIICEIGTHTPYLGPDLHFESLMGWAEDSRSIARIGSHVVICSINVYEGGE